MILHCARRTTTASSCGFREHGGLLEPSFAAHFPGAQDHTGFFQSVFLPLGSCLVESPTARNFLTRPSTGTRDVPVARARAFRFFLPLLKGVAQAALYCAHRTSTVSSCAFCEQEGRLAALSSHLSLHAPPFLSRVAWIGSSPRASREHILIVRTLRAKGTIQATLPLP